MDKLARGKHVEDATRRFLEARNLQHICSNFRSRWGEIDLIMRDQLSLVFIEVRFRGTSSYVSGAVSVDSRKQQKLCKTASQYLAQHARIDTIARFDVVSVSQDENGKIQFEWIKNAFDCS